MKAQIPIADVAAWQVGCLSQSLNRAIFVTSPSVNQRKISDQGCSLNRVRVNRRQLDRTFAFANRILNIHPSLLPAFPGIDAQRQALEHGARVAGATVHFVTGELDGGPIIAQRAIPVLDDDTAETLVARILDVEHRIYPEAVGLVLDGGWTIEGRRFRGGRSITG